MINLVEIQTHSILARLEQEKWWRNVNAVHVSVMEWRSREHKFVYSKAWMNINYRSSNVYKKFKWSSFITHLIQHSNKKQHFYGYLYHSNINHVLITLFWKGILRINYKADPHYNRQISADSGAIYYI